MSRPTINAEMERKEYNVQTYRGWLKHGRQVRKGERAYKGLFHITQTDVIDDKPDTAVPQHHATRPIASQETGWERVKRQQRIVHETRAWGNAIYGLGYLVIFGAIIYNVVRWLLHWI